MNDVVGVMPLDARFERFAFYLNQLEVWKVKFPYLATFRSPLPGDEQGIPNFALPVAETPFALLANCIEWLDRYIMYDTELKEADRANFVYTVFDELDVAWMRSGAKILTVNEKFRVYINTFRYWKPRSGPRPLSSSSHSFESFGLCHWDTHCRHLVVSELVQGRGDPLRRIPNLNIGLFPLSEKWTIQWKYTKPLNATRKTHGFIAVDTLNDNRKDELSELVDIIRDNQLHVACFPELMLRPQDQADLWNLLLENYIKPLGLPFFLLVGGSFHESAGAYFVNRMPLQLYCFDQTFTYAYCKLEPFSARLSDLVSIGNFDLSNLAHSEFGSDPASDAVFLKEHASEDIGQEPGITIVETETFGKFGFAICKDVLPYDSKILGQYANMVDHLIVVSLNVSDKADFGTIATQLAWKRGIATFYVNARKYDPKNATPTFWVDIQNVKGSSDVVVKTIGPDANFLLASFPQKGLPSKRTL
jgi:hypothetical protein